MSTSWRKLRKEIEDMCGAGNDPQHKNYVMVSGGVDSLFLLDFLCRSSVKFEIIHFKHGIRSVAEEMKDYDCIWKVIDRNNRTDIRIHVGKGNLTTDSTETQARNARWQFAQEVSGFGINKQNYPMFLSGHQRDEQIESVFLNLIRGKPHNDLTMQTFTDFGTHCRYKPLLDITKAEIIQQCVSRNLTWNEDITNTSSDADRNWLRNEILPALNTRRNLLESMREGMLRTYI